MIRYLFRTWMKWFVKRRVSPRLLDALERLSIWLDIGSGIVRPLKIGSWWLNVNHWARSKVGENLTVTFSDRRYRFEVEDNWFDFLLDLHQLGGAEEDPHGTIVLYYVPTGALKKKLFFDDHVILDYDVGSIDFNWVMKEGLHGAGPDAIPRIVLYTPERGWLSDK